MDDEDSATPKSPGASADTAAEQDAGSGPPAEAVLEMDGLFEALSHARRRYLLYTLTDGNDEDSLGDLAREIAAWERDSHPDRVADEAVERVEQSLYHAHVPKLADLDIVEYEDADEVLVRARNTEQVQSVLEAAGGELDVRLQEHVRDAGGER